MTSPQLSRPDAPLAGWRAAGVRSGLAPAPLSRASVWGVAAALALGVLEVLAGEEVLVAALLVLPPLAVALTGRWGDTLLVAAVSLVVALVAPLVGDAMQLAISFVLVLAGGALAVALALARAGSAVAIERFRLLADVADVADRADGHDALVEGVLDLLVPALGDVAALDVIRRGRRSRIGTRAGPGVDVAVEAALQRRRSLVGERRSSEAVMAEDVARLVEPDDALMASMARTPEDAALFQSLRLATAVIVPLRARGGVIGAFTASYGPSGRRHTEGDLRFAEVLGGRVALALDNAGLTSELSEAEEQFGVVVHTLAEAVLMNDPAGRIVYANHAAAELLGVGADELVGAPPGDLMDRFAVFDAHGRPIALSDLPSRRLLSGEPEPPPLLVRNVVRATGEERWLLHRCSALRDADGAVVRLVNVIENVTEVKRAEWTQRLLAEASAALSSSMDPAEQLDALVRVLVPALAQRAVVELPDERGEPERVAEAGEAIEEPGGELRVPLPAGAEALGTLTLVRGAPWRAFGAAERELAAEIGRRAGVAVSNARSHTRRTAIARALQHGLLPPELPEVPGWSAAVLYRPAGEFNEVGGDFYDVFDGPRGWMVVIGDVAGQGAEAAAQTSLARFTLRTAAELTGDVSAAVGRLNDTLRGQAGLPLCTVVCAELRERGDGTAVVTMASAGHPPPLRVRGHEVTPVGKSGTIAGAFAGLQWPAAPVELRPGDLLVLYTDGVTDAMGEDERYGEARLREALGRLEGEVGERLDALRGELEAFERGPQRDDTTVLVLQYRGGGAQPAEASRRAASSMTSGRLQNAKRTRSRPASGSS
jgi:PAS domain S-box-containing protein